MSTARSFNRVGVIRRLVEVAEAGTADDVGCFYSDPGDQLTDLCLWFGPVGGVASRESFGTNPIKIDRFTVTGYILAVEGDTEPWVSAQAALDVLRDFDMALRKLHCLQDAVGETSPIGNGDTDLYAGIRGAQITQVNGPDALVFHANDHALPFFGITFEVSCETHLAVVT